MHLGRIDDAADGFARRPREIANKGTFAMHPITPPEITVHQWKATVEASASMMMRFDVDSHQCELISYCRLMYRLSQVDEAGVENQRSYSDLREGHDSADCRDSRRGAFYSLINKEQGQAVHVSTVQCEREITALRRTQGLKYYIL